MASLGTSHAPTSSFRYEEEPEYDAITELLPPKRIYLCSTKAHLSEVAAEGETAGPESPDTGSSSQELHKALQGVAMTCGFTSSSVSRPGNCTLVTDLLSTCYGKHFISLPPVCGFRDYPECDATVVTCNHVPFAQQYPQRCWEGKWCRDDFKKQHVMCALSVPGLTTR